MPITPGGGRARVVHAFTHSTFIVVTWRFCMEARDAERLLRVQWVFNVMTTVVSENLEYFNAYLYVCLVCLLRISQCQLGAWKCPVLNSCHRQHDETLVLHSTPVRLCYTGIPSKYDSEDKNVSLCPRTHLDIQNSMVDAHKSLRLVMLHLFETKVKLCKDWKST